MHDERILVAGTGALGSVFGVFLAAAGRDVAFLGRPAHLDAVRERGLSVEGLFGERVVRDVAVATDPGALRAGGPFGVVLLTVKAYDTDAILAATVPLVARDGCVVSLQNGLGNLERVVDAVGPDRAVGGRVIFGAAVTEPGRARVTVCAEPVAIGAVARGNASAERHAHAVAAAIAAAGCRRSTPPTCTRTSGRRSSTTLR